MKTQFKPYLLPLLLLLSCNSNIDINETARKKADKAPTIEDTNPVSFGKIYITGIEYPQGYDWRNENQSKDINCKLFVLEEGKDRILEVEVAPENHISAALDMHRVIKGNLYTDYSTDTETIIKKNGEELFRYPKREGLNGFLIKDKNVYTLGYSRNGIGWSYRKNGEVIIEKENGYPTSELYEDDGKICFSYNELLGNNTENVLKSYMAIDGISREIGKNNSITEIYDSRMVNGQLIYICKTSKINSPVLYIEESSQILKHITPIKIQNLKINKDRDSIYFTANLNYANKYMHQIINKYTVFNKDSLGHEFPLSLKAYKYESQGDKNLACGHCFNDIYHCFIYWNNKGTTIRGNYYHLEGNKSQLLNGNNAYVLFANKISNMPPIIWKNGKHISYPINGYLCGIYLN